MVKLKLVFDSCQSCYLRCSKTAFQSLTNKKLSDTTGVSLKLNSSKALCFTLSAYDFEDDGVVYLNKIFGAILQLQEQVVSIEEIQDLQSVSELALACSPDDYALVQLHRSQIEDRFMDQIKVVTEDMPIVLWLNMSIHLKFTIANVKPLGGQLISTYTKVAVLETPRQQTKLNNLSQKMSFMITKIHYNEADEIHSFKIPEISLSCFCGNENMLKIPVILSKACEAEPDKILCYLKHCKKCKDKQPHTLIFADNALKPYVQLNETVVVYFPGAVANTVDIALNILSPEVSSLKVPSFNQQITSYSLIVATSNRTWKIDLVKDDEMKMKVAKTTELGTVKKHTKENNPHSLVYESIVDKFIHSFAFPRKSISLLTSNAHCYGAGKTYFMDCLKADKRLRNFYVLYSNATQFRGKRVDNVVKEIMELLDCCYFNQPSILLLDNLDSVLPAHSKSEAGSGDELFGARLAQKLVHLFEKFSRVNVEIIISCQSVSSCHPILLDTCQKISILPLLTYSQQISFLHSLLDGKLSKDSLSKHFSDLSLKTNLTVGEVVKLRNAFDLNGVGKMSLGAVKNEISPVCKLFELQKKKPATSVTMTDCGGLADVKIEINKMLVLPYKYPQLFSQIPFQLNRGLLLYGPPGVGKTHIVKAIASDIDMSFMTVKGPELLNKYIGASEEAVRNLFDKAQEMSPTLIFFDEFDSLAPLRGDDTTGVMDRVVNQLLTELDGVSKKDGVFIVAATSRPDSIDPAILRPGRIGRNVLCPMPGPSERAEIWSCLLKNVKYDQSVDLTVLAAETAYYSGADIKAIIYNAQLGGVKKCISNPGTKSVPLTQKELLDSIANTPASLCKSDMEDYERRYDEFLSGRKSIVGRKTTQR